MPIKQHPELTRNYPAIDGIAHKPKLRQKTVEKHDYSIKKLPIRSDIEKILKLSDSEFNNWYHEHKEKTERLLRDYETFANIPDLSDGERSYKMGNYPVITQMIEYFRKGLDYLDKIKQVRAEYRER